MSEYIPEDLFVGDPVLALRWRLQHRALPLKNRHLRAFSQGGVSNGLASWARQHIEWTLAEGAGAQPDGVLTLSVDGEGRAVMGIEPYIALPPLASRDLLGRVAEQAGQAVEGEVVWLVGEGSFTALTDAGKPLSGTNSLMADLAKTLGGRVSFMPLEGAGLERASVLDGAAEVLLVSDEHGVVGAADSSGAVAAQFRAYYDRIVALARPDAFDRANLGIVG